MIVYLPPGDQWDQTMVRDLLTAVPEPLPKGDGLIIVIPGRYWHDRIDDINAAIACYPWVLAIRTGDEEDLLDIVKVVHPNIRWWVQTPRVGGHYDARLIPLGYTPHFADMAPDPPTKHLDVFLAAQDTHARRHEAFDHLEGRRNSRVVKTPGFTQGLTPADYRDQMLAAKAAPCPSGAVSPDSFRVYEALQAHTVPIADDRSPAYASVGYWRLLFPEAPFPILTDYDDLAALITRVTGDWPQYANRVTAWWMAEKRALAAGLLADLAALGAPTPTPPTTTVLITASPIKSHPDTTIIEETVASVRAQLPDVEIIIAHDGIRPEQEHMRADYEDYLRRLLWMADHKWHNVLPTIVDQHLHQGLLTKRALTLITTPLVLFVEHDTPFRDDAIGNIPWLEIERTILGGQANSVRFHHEAAIPPEHLYLMPDQGNPLDVGGVPLIRTAQWSQRPHLASVAFYHRMLDTAFADEQRDFIEDAVYGELCDAYRRHGAMGWQQWRTWIYGPPGSIARSYHTDGRQDASKFDQ